jgi:LuxR family maltose regulon positive regulatory protein
MRTLASAALREPAAGNPADWLETKRRKSASFAKYRSAMISACKNCAGHRFGVSLSARENDILSGLYLGLSRPEIAAKYSLSVNTVNSAVNSIYGKLGAGSVAEVIRIAAEEKLVKP